MVKLSAGNEVLAYCGKCKLKLAHTIVVMKTDEIPDKVKCNTCKSTHAFKENATRRRAVASKGKAAFFAPLILILPSSEAPPIIRNEPI